MRTAAGTRCLELGEREGGLKESLQTEGKEKLEFWHGETYKHSAELIQHPVLERIQALEILLGASSLQEIRI